MLAEFAERVKYFFDLFCALNFHDDALLASGFELPILETDSLIGVVEAKKVGVTLSTVADQSAHYGENLPDFLKTADSLPFFYESTGIETFFRDERDPEHVGPRAPMKAICRPTKGAEGSE